MRDVNMLWITFVTLGTGCPPVPRRFSLPTAGHEKECVTHTTMGMVSLPTTRVKYSSSTIHSPYYLYYTHFSPPHSWVTGDTAERTSSGEVQIRARFTH